MRKSTTKVLTGVFLVIVCVLIYTNISEKKETLYTGNQALDIKLTKSEIKEDRDTMIEYLETTHPIFLEEAPKEYKDAKKEFIKECSNIMTLNEFQWSVSKYLSSLEDAHTVIGWEEDSSLAVNWKYIDDKLVLLDNNTRPTNKVVTHINDTDIDKILKIINDYLPAENHVAEEQINTRMLKQKLLLMNSGIDCTKDIILTTKENDKVNKIKVSFDESNKNKHEKNDTNEKEIYSKKIDENTIYVRFGFCKIDRELYGVVNDLKQAMNDNIENVIIDVIDNPGGNSNACDMILNAIGISPGRFGSTVRYSKLAKSIYPDYESEGSETYERHNNVVKNEDVNLYVLMSEYSFSSAQWMCTYVKDGKLGTLIGQPSINMPSSYGDGIPFELPNSKIKGIISHKKWLRPDESRDDEVLDPDVKLDYGEDALGKALELIKK